MSQVEYWIWLQHACGPGSPKPAELVRRFGSVERIYSAKAADYTGCGSTGCGSADCGPGLSRLNKKELSRLCDKSLDQSQKTVEKCLEKGYKIITMQDDDYPPQLLNCYAPPCVLYVEGSAVWDGLPVAMVGTRKVTEYGVSAATKIAMGLVRYGAVVVSGLAIGVDAASHSGALKGGGRTIAVIGCGLDCDYPAANRELRRMISLNGAVVSEYPPGTRPLSMNFPIRNRIIAGLSKGTVVIEAGSRSGSLITANLALEMGRDVFAVPGSIFSPMSEGTNRLLRDGAKPVCGALDVLEEYLDPEAQAPVGAEPETSDLRPTEPRQLQIVSETEPPAKGGSSVRKAPAGLTRTQSAVYSILGEKPLHVDQIALRANLEPRVVLASLTILEIQGLAKSFPGRRFCIV